MCDVDTSVDKHNRDNKWETHTSVGFRQLRNDEVYVSHVATQREEYAPTSMYSIRLRHFHRRATRVHYVYKNILRNSKWHI